MKAKKPTLKVGFLVLLKLQHHHQKRRQGDHYGVYHRTKDEIRGFQLGFFDYKDIDVQGNGKKYYCTGDNTDDIICGHGTNCPKNKKSYSAKQHIKHKCKFEKFSVCFHLIFS